jgi:hypothetical protein
VNFANEAREVLDSLHSFHNGYPSESLSKEAIEWLYSVAYKEFRAKARKEAERQIANELP